MTINTTYQRRVTRLCVQCTLIALRNGCESVRAEELAIRLGKALKMERIEIAISSTAVILTTICDRHCMTTARRNLGFGINMLALYELCHLVEKVQNKTLNINALEQQLVRIHQKEEQHYPKTIRVIAAALSCASFGVLNNASPLEFLAIFCSAALGMLTKELFNSIKLNPMINFSIIAFVATSVAGFWVFYLPSGHNSQVVMASSILLLVPGMPLITAVSDFYKGYTLMGLGRWATATALTLATCLGVIIAMFIWKLTGWS